MQRQAQLNRRATLAMLAGTASLAGNAGAAVASGSADRPVDRSAIDELARHFMAEFEIPGLAILILNAGEVAHLQGYGVRTLGMPEPVDLHTRFGIASNTKAFTSAALATLVDSGAISWDDLVFRHLPEFRMHDPVATESMTIRDLLVHRSGLPTGAGDLLFWPPSTHPTADILKALPYLKPARPFRSGYAYDNALYLVAGLLIERVSGQSWRDFVTGGLLRPLGMKDATASALLVDTNNVSGRHARLGPPVQGLGPLVPVNPKETGAKDPSGGIYASISDLAPWLKTQLRRGLTEDGRRLWSSAQADEMWKPQTIVSAADGLRDGVPWAVTATYALGWGVQDYRGHRLISHSGGHFGYVTQVAMIPSLNLAAAVFSNINDSSSEALMRAVLDEVMDAPRVDWAAILKAGVTKWEARALSMAAKSAHIPAEARSSLPLSAYVGVYRDPWYGDIKISRSGSGLRIEFLPTPTLQGQLELWGQDTFRTRFAPEAGEDALVTFAIDRSRVTRVMMKAFSPLADPSYDFQDLDFLPA